MRLAWATDIHLNFLSDDEIRSFCRGVESIGSSALVISGDIGEAPTVVRYLETLADELDFPIYFVLGNHDYYRGSIRRVRKHVTELCKQRDDLIWLPAEGVVELSPAVALLGHDGWADGRLGDYESSAVLLNDYLLIDELSGLTKRTRLVQLEALGNEAATFVWQHLPGAAEKYEKLFFVTHVPPFAEASWHEHGLSDDDWLPHFACKAVGEALVGVLETHPDCDVTVLCGHTHGRGVAKILPNLTVRTGAAVYGKPLVEELIEL